MEKDHENKYNEKTCDFCERPSITLSFKFEICPKCSKNNDKCKKMDLHDHKLCITCYCNNRKSVIKYNGFPQG